MKTVMSIFFYDANRNKSIELIIKESKLKDNVEITVNEYNVVESDKTELWYMTAKAYIQNIK